MAQLLQAAVKNLKSIITNRLFVILSLLLIVSGTLLFYKQTANTQSSSANSGPVVAQSKVSVAPAIVKQPLWQKVNITIQPGENLSEVFDRLGLSQGDLQDIIAEKRAHSELTLLLPKEKMEVLLGPNHVVEQLNFPINLKEMLQVTRVGEEYVAKIIPFPTEIKYKTVSGIIKRSFSTDAVKAKLHPKQVKEFSRIFADEINFKEIKPGDQFSVVYEAYYANNEEIGSGEIVAAEYVDRYHRSYRAIRDTDSRGRYNYYTPNGTNLRKAFVRYPLVFRRISSRFSLQRAHPVLGKIVRPHKGVDFAAPIGRPVEASGDGEIIFAGTKTGFGNTVIIRHTRRYKTLYAHLDHFAEGTRRGKRVLEGEVIAYVGETGIATGPHLHYEFSVDGKQHNPLTVSFPNASGIPVANRPEFAAKVKEFVALLVLPQPKKNTPKS